MYMKNIFRTNYDNFLRLHNYSTDTEKCVKTENPIPSFCREVPSGRLSRHAHYTILNSSSPHD